MPRITECWKPVPNWSNYEVSNHGRIRRLPYYVRSRGGKRLIRGGAIEPKTLNYQTTVVLHAPGRKERYVSVGRLVLEAFVRLGHPGEVCRHFFNPDTTDNRLENLRWGMPADNAADQVRHYGKHPCTIHLNTQKANAKKSKHKKNRLIKITLETVQRVRELLATGLSQAKVGHIVNLAQSTVGDISRNPDYGTNL